MSTSNNLSLEQVSVAVGDKTLIKDVNLDFEPEKIYTIIGPSGTGKSTLLNLVAGLLPYTGGNVSYQGRPYDPKAQVIGLVPQNYGLLPWETAWKTVTASLEIRNGHKVTGAEAAVVQDIFEKMNLTQVMHAYPKAMSGGQQQRVSLARAFAIAGDFLLMDEPFSALDAFTRDKLQKLFLTIWSEHPQTTLFITHDIEEALLLGHRIIIMNGQPGRVTQVLDNPLGEPTFDTQARRQDPEFFEWVNRLRKEIYQDDEPTQ